jgi:thioesterase domain-containing protein
MFLRSVRPHPSGFIEPCLPVSVELRKCDYGRASNRAAKRKVSSKRNEDHLGRSRLEIVCLQKGSDNTPLYCMPTITGSVSSYIDLAKIVGVHRPVYGIRIANRAQISKLETFTSLSEMAASIASELLTHHRNGPICLLGYSFGGYLAIEVARQLVRKDKIVALVGIIDQMPPRASFAPVHRIYFCARNAGPWALKVAARIVTDAKQWSNYRDALLRKLNRLRKVQTQKWYQDLPEDRKNVVIQNLANRLKYRFEGTYRGTIFLFRPPSSSRGRAEPLPSWEIGKTDQNDPTAWLGM